MAGNTFIPFNFNPSSVFTSGSGVYTVPSNKYARVLLIPKVAADFGELYIKKSGGSETYSNTSVTNNNTSWPITQATHTLLTIASGYKARLTLISATISSSNGVANVAWTGAVPAAGTIITIPQNGSNSTGTISVDYTGPGNFTVQNVGAGNTNYSSSIINTKLYRTGEATPDVVDSGLNPAAIAAEIWLSSLDEISFEGGLIVDEYDKPS